MHVWLGAITKDSSLGRTVVPALRGTGLVVQPFDPFSTHDALRTGRARRGVQPADGRVVSDARRPATESP